MKSLPEALLKELDSVAGFDRGAFLEAHGQDPATSVRVNPHKIAEISTRQSVPWCGRGFYLNERPIFTLDPAYHAGAYYVQEASSMFLDHVLRSLLPGRTGLRILDLCAAPGGKSTLMAGWMDKDCLLISNDVIRTRAAILEENMSRWGYMNTWVTSNDPRDFGKLEGYFDVIVVDAPCSGSGLFRKDERAIDEWSEANVQLCSERQRRILADVWPALKQNGLLIYATCSYSPQEDEQVLDWLGGSFEMQSLNVPVDPEWGIVKVKSPQRHIAGYRFFPHRVRGEGFFIAACMKTGESGSVKPPKFKVGSDRQVQQQAAWLIEPDDVVFMREKESNSAIRSCHEADLHLLQKAVYLRKAGVRLGAPAGKDWIPEHDVALSIDAHKSIRSLEVTREQALRYLKREDIGITMPERGWLMIKYNGLGLGWVKSLGNRLNNYLPRNWRIRMDIAEDLENVPPL